MSLGHRIPWTMRGVFGQVIKRHCQQCIVRDSATRLAHVLAARPDQYDDARLVSVCTRQACRRHSTRTKVPTSQDIRRAFTDYFVSARDHTFVPSSPVHLPGDASLLFVNAGMNQFKPIFVGTVEPSSPMASLRRAANSQKCIRVGGKHNDLEEVGKDLHHHTFFEMLGNWSFGDYFKKEACAMAVELLTHHYKIPKEWLFVTYFGGDASLGLEPDLECRDVWLDLGFPKEKIFALEGHENFWEMGVTGPCGPCTEIHYCPGNEIQQATELWNLVFIQYERMEDGTLRKLPVGHVDTGMGLERMTALLQGTHSNYDTDLFKPLLEYISKACKSRPYAGNTGARDVDGLDANYRIIADHCRMFTVAIADGVRPDAKDAGNILRKIMKKAVLCAQRLNAPAGMLASLADLVAESLEGAYQEIGANLHLVKDIICEEEQRTLLHYSRAVARLRDIVASHAASAVLPGEKVWELYADHGIPRSVLEELVHQQGLNVSWDGFDRMLQEEREKTKRAFDVQKKSSCWSPLEVLSLLEEAGIQATDSSHQYAYTSEEDGTYRLRPLASKVAAVLSRGRLVEQLHQGDEGIVVLEETSFYAEKGGQASDVGLLHSYKGCVMEVDKAVSIQDYVLHFGHVARGSLSVGDKVDIVIDESHRLGCMRNHTATHLLNAALRHILPGTCQKSSYVGPDHLRFEFAAKQQLSYGEIEKVEGLVHSAIREGCLVRREIVPLSRAMEDPEVVTLPGEMYPDPVSLIVMRGDASVLSSCELCCGTHLHSTSHVEDFLIVKQKSTGQTVRSVHAVTGTEAQRVRHMQEQVAEWVDELQGDATQPLPNKMDAETYRTLKGMQQRIRDIKTVLQSGTVGLLFRMDAEAWIAKIEEGIKRKLGKYHSTTIKEELRAHVSQTSEGHCIIYQIQAPGDGTAVGRIAAQVLSNRPYWIFFASEDESDIAFQCSVPQGWATSSFTAELWASHVKRAVPAKSASRQRGDPRLFCEGRGICRSEMPAAMQAAKQFVEQVLPFKSSQQ